MAQIEGALEAAGHETFLPHRDAHGSPRKRSSTGQNFT